MDIALKRAKIIKAIGITTLSVGLAWILFFIISIFVPFMMWLGVVAVVAWGPACLTAAILILITDWQCAELDDCKVLWGVLGILLLPSIAPTVFGVKAVKALTNINSSTNSQTIPSSTIVATTGGNSNANVTPIVATTPTTSVTNAPTNAFDKSVMDKVEKIKNLYEEELLTEAEATSKISKILTDASIGE